ncbi:hypothetical protein FBUS_05561 [Fasciolopsis buskii]|uniref:EF-hand domain-containing protein n=1 Tax=Fasciolopsis buskii TaxID=27845 RepID=A0A8E0RR14_9TREM|nr:hypothetical protein FBUS_05561 [Fasciolopsis buski]
MALKKLLDTKFEWMDRTNDGYLSRADVEEMVILHGLPTSVIKEFMDYCDTDKDGKVSKEEFNEARRRRPSRKLNFHAANSRGFGLFICTTNAGLSGVNASRITQSISRCTLSAAYGPLRYLAKSGDMPSVSTDICSQIRKTRRNGNVNPLYLSTPFDDAARLAAEVARIALFL